MTKGLAYFSKSATEIAASRALAAWSAAMMAPRMASGILAPTGQPSDALGRHAQLGAAPSTVRLAPRRGEWFRRAGRPCARHFQLRCGAADQAGFFASAVTGAAGFVGIDAA